MRSSYFLVALFLIACSGQEPSRPDPNWFVDSGTEKTASSSSSGSDVSHIVSMSKKPTGPGGRVVLSGRGTTPPADGGDPDAYVVLDDGAIQPDPGTAASLADAGEQQDSGSADATAASLTNEDFIGLWNVTGTFTNTTGSPSSRQVIVDNNFSVTIIMGSMTYACNSGFDVDTLVVSCPTENDGAVYRLVLRDHDNFDGTLKTIINGTGGELDADLTGVRQ